ncbi:MAG: hypothetical protein M3Y04_09510 [Actinomycetota bacterium]|nr:hypothetical protein [Actinomycetota bacterium]
MRKRTVLTVLAAAAMTLHLVGSVGVAHAADPEVVFRFSPGSGPPGTKITFSGTGCVHNAANAFDGVFFLTQGSNSTAPVQFFGDAAGAFSGQYDTTALQPGQYTTFATCTNAPVRGGPGDIYTVTPPLGSTYFGVAPARLLDTRDGTGTGGVASPLGTSGVVELKVTDVAGVPATGVTAVALNVTATGASADSNIKVWPTGSPEPGTSNLNFTPGVSEPNLVIARVGTGGKISIRNNVGNVDVVADLQGWYSIGATGGSTYVPTNPQRILDTRDGTGTGGSVAQVGQGGIIDLGVTGVAGVPADATAVVLNMTVDQATGPESYLTVFPAGTSIPNASNLNFVGGPATTNLVIARVGSGGQVAIFNHLAATDVIADVQGFFSPSATGSTYFPTDPARILDSRDGTGTPNGAVGQLGENNTINVPVTGVGGVPTTGVSAVVLNVTVADSPGPESFLTLFPAGTARQMTSNLNFSAGEQVPNLVIVRVVNGSVSIYNHVGSTNVIADVQGWFRASS